MINRLIYDITPQELGKVEKHKLDICYTCKQKIKVGDKVFSKNASSSRRVLRHLECARRVNLV